MATRKPTTTAQGGAGSPHYRTDARQTLEATRAQLRQQRETRQAEARQLHADLARQRAHLGSQVRTQLQEFQKQAVGPHLQGPGTGPAHPSTEGSPRKPRPTAN